ncbi:MAG: SgcJ/EcaC family oxidoreductase [Calditrichaeota bacterium]|nr:MAG: SgcJ/EcaC family oxidoreductase [Calditrichota bacterium]
MLDEKTAIENLYAENVAALIAGDVAALARFYTHDAIQFPPGAPPLVGWDAIRSSLEHELDGIALDATVEIVEVVIAGDWAYARGHYHTAVIPQAGGRRTVTTGSWLDILKRQADGSWKISRSAWSSYEPAEEAT